MIIYKCEFPDGKVYIGATKLKDLQTRIDRHIETAADPKRNTNIQQEIRKYLDDPSVLKWSVAARAKDLNQLVALEIQHIADARREYGAKCLNKGSGGEALVPPWSTETFDIRKL